MDTQANTPFWQDKSFYLVVLTPVFMLISKWLKIEFNVQEIAAFVAIAATFIGSSKWKSREVLVAEIKRDALQAAAAAPPASSPAAALAEAMKPSATTTSTAP